ncbi:MAG: hypothetical protein ACRDNS_20035 [Trebonia sp.]
MELQILNPSPKYAPPEFVPPPSAGYLHIGAAVAPPVGPPFVRRDPRRTALLDRLKHIAADIERSPEVRSVTVYRAVLVPPAGRTTPHPARFDVAVLIETSSPEVLDEVRGSEPYRQLLAAITAVTTDVHAMAARCLRSLGEVDRRRPGLFLFNHFTAPHAEAATGLWEHLAGWYVAETGLDNSTLLAPIGASDYVFVNHARWDKSLPRFALEQFSKKTFRSYVRANLKANQVVAMPVLYRLA